MLNGIIQSSSKMLMESRFLNKINYDNFRGIIFVVHTYLLILCRCVNAFGIGANE